MTDEQQREAVDLLEYALHLRMHGERAPGGTETWVEFDRRCEEFLRRQLEAKPIKEPDVTLCPSTIHDEDGEPHPEAKFAGTFQAPWWEPGRTERVTYCLRCAGMMTAVSYLTLDEPSAEVEAWIEAKDI